MTDTITPFNPALHEHLLSLGYVHERIAEYYYDDGDAENGPRLAGCPAYDQYEGPEDRFFAVENGMIDRAVRDLEHERWLEAHAE